MENLYKLVYALSQKATFRDPKTGRIYCIKQLKELDTKEAEKIHKLTNTNNYLGTPIFYAKDTKTGQIYILTQSELSELEIIEGPKRTVKRRERLQLTDRVDYAASPEEPERYKRDIEEEIDEKIEELAEEETDD